MASARVVITKANDDTPAVGEVFDGLSFFLVQRLPSRSTFVQKIKANGGRIVKHETQADHIIADHVRQDSPAGSLSYKFIEAAIKDGELPDPADHAAGPSHTTVRPAGSAVPGKSTRTPFTADDDKVLWQWVERHRKQGGLVKGNEMYKQLEKINPRHTYQAWRDRYIKKLMDNPPAGVEVVVPANAPPSPPTAQDSQERVAGEPAAASSAGGKVVKSKEEAEAEEESDPSRHSRSGGESPEFTEEDRQLLLEQGPWIVKIDPSQRQDAWERWAEHYPPHSATVWHRFWRDDVRPTYLQLRKSTKEKAASVSPAGSQKRSREVQETQSSPKRQRIEPRTTPRQEELGSQASPKRSRPETQSPSKPSRLQEAPTQPVDESERETVGLEEAQIHRTEESERETVAPFRDTGEVEAHDLKQPQPFPYSTQVIEIDSTDSESQETTTPAIQQNMEFTRTVSSVSIPVSSEEVDNAILDELEDATEEALTKGSDKLREGEGKDDRMQLLLTESNLVDQQALHQTQLLRGTDLLEDDDNNDVARQEEYRVMLENAARLATQTQGPSLEDASEPHMPDPEHGNSFQSLQSMSIRVESLQYEPKDELVSSQQEIDEAFEANINWPNSPTASPKEPVGTLSQFETQVHYPELQERRLDTLQADEVPVLQTQIPIQQEVSYPPLAEAASQAILSQPLGLDGAADAQTTVENSRVEIDAEEEAEDREDSMDDASLVSAENDIDLSIPEPDGGWNQSSPPRLEPTQSVNVPFEQSARTTPFHDAEEGREDAISESEAEVYHETSRGTSPSSSSSSSEAGDSISDARSRARPGGTVLETQDILNAETQQPDLGMPLPFGFEEDESEAERTPSRGNWTKFEDDLLLHGMQNGLRTTEILATCNLNRSPSAIRNRRAILLKHNPEVQYSRETSSSSSSSSHPELPSDPFQIPASSPPRKVPKAASAPAPAPTTESQSLLSDGDGEAYETYITHKVLIEGHHPAAVNEALRRTSMRDDLADLVLLEAKAGKGLPANVRGIWSVEEDRICESGDARGLRRLEEKHGWDEIELRMQFLQDLRE